MKTRSTLYPGAIGGVVATLASATQVSAKQIPGKVPGGCAEPPRRPSEIGCYLSEIHPVEKLPDEPLFWHLYTYPTPAAAETAKTESLSTVAESLDKVWLFAIASRRTYVVQPVRMVERLRDAEQAHWAQRSRIWESQARGYRTYHRCQGGNVH